MAITVETTGVVIPKLPEPPAGYVWHWDGVCQWLMRRCDSRNLGYVWGATCWPNNQPREYIAPVVCESPEMAAATLIVGWQIVPIFGWELDGWKQEQKAGE